MQRFNRKNLWWLVISILIIAIDQITKYLASEFLPYAEPQAVLPFLNITLMHNAGSAFSFLSDASGWQRWLLGLVAVIVSGFIVVWLLRLERTDKWNATALSLILGGAIGNLIDRIRLGYVVDFIDVYYKTWHWPDFNVADSAICVGAFMLFVGIIFFKKSL